MDSDAPYPSLFSAACVFLIGGRLSQHIRHAVSVISAEDVGDNGAVPSVAHAGAVNVEFTRCVQWVFVVFMCHILSDSL